MLVYLACSAPGDGRRYTNMYETRNETKRVVVAVGRSQV
jgi:hypothetical protein